MDTTSNQNSLHHKQEEKNYIFDTKEFNKPNHELNWKYSIQNSYHFKKDIDRIWLVIRSFDALSMLSNQNNYPCIMLKGEDIWEEGNEFKGIIFGMIPFVAKVKECMSLPEMKKIEWLLNLNNNEYFILGIELFKVTEDNTTVAIKQFKFETEALKQKTENSDYKIYDNSLFENIEFVLNKNPINLLKYESTIINGKMEDVWDIITDCSKFTSIAPNNNYLPNINIRNLKKDEKVEAKLFYNNEIINLEIILKYKEENPGWHKWLIVFEISATTQKKIPKHTVAMQLIKITDKKCQLSLFTKFLEPIETKEYEEYADKKKYLLNSFKDYFDNFYTPSQ